MSRFPAAYNLSLLSRNRSGWTAYILPDSSGHPLGFVPRRHWRLNLVDGAVVAAVGALEADS
jgi:hypothetical protein